MAEERRDARWQRKPARTAGRDAAARPGSRRAPSSATDVTILYGWHPVLEALRNEHRAIRRLLATENAARRLTDELKTPRMQPEIVRPTEIDRLVEPDAVHQGLYLEADALPSPTLDSLGPEAIVLALDQITDPHNVGAIVRSAAAFDVDAILTTGRHSPAATGVLAKAASGGLEHVPFLVERNLADALVALGERGFQRIGFDSDGDTPLDKIAVRRPLVVVLGAEGRGLRQRTRQCCDVIGRLDAPGAIKSLNVSNAAAITLYAITRGA